jgi:HAUS augmin-like complex subunit 3
MSGAALCAALTELGFDGEDPLDADALEWPFQYEEARPLLAWICSCLRPSNVLSPSHLAQ